ncbi:MAG TPA: DUF1616 domain-containing protein [Methanoregulaceae archaeon]|nr:DUF1616 domain-containing protein [Methanoregulaceae archaeon]HQJ87268.1 DUF1616 domain-containing protein [Methanoregulaceae archaeon]
MNRRQTDGKRTRQARTLLDLIGAVALTGLTLLSVYIPILNQSPLRVASGLVMILLVPGYLLMAALFPRNDELTWIERLALSIGFSIAVVPLIGFVLNATPEGIRLDSILIWLSGYSILMAAVGAFRRLSLPVDAQLVLPVPTFVRDLGAGLSGGDGASSDRTISVFLLVSLVFTIGSICFVVLVPGEGRPFSEFYVLDEQGRASDYPVSLSANTSRSVIIGVRNQEFHEMHYTVETLLVNQSFDPTTNRSSIDRMRLLDRYEVVVPHNQTSERRVNCTVTEPGFNRLQFLLFSGTPPPDDLMGQGRIDASYRDLHLRFRFRSG